MFGRAKMDPQARQVALGIGASRVAMGVGIFFATQPALRAMGFGPTNASGEAVAKLGGGRDVVFGALTLAARDDREALRAALLLSGACDLADALAMGVSARRPETRGAGIGGVVAGGAAAAACLWARRRLSA
ncbi:MAG: hypothetical protein QOF06_577 [Solirubrobacterales bacterium]|jgi:hypothetical protein|nr:hypothetical protein [Solirubrobacterales bacterium]